MTTALSLPVPRGASARRAEDDTASPRFWHVYSSESPPAEGSFIALVPGEDVVALTVSLPPTLKGKPREEVAIRQVYDRLSAKSESLQVLPVSISGTGNSWSSVLVARRQAIDEWHQRLGSTDQRCRALLPDYLALPSAPGLWTIAVSSDHGRAVVQVRLGVGDGFTSEAALAAFALTRARSTLPAPEAVLCIGPVEPAVEAALDGLPLVRSLQALSGSQASAGVLLQSEEMLDLRPHRRQHGKPIFARQARNLRWPLLFVALGTIAWGASIELEARKHQVAADAIKEDVLAVVRRDVLPSGPIVDIRIQVEREMERLRLQAASFRKSNGLLERFRLITHILAGEENLEIVSAMLRDGEGISISLSTPDFYTLDRISVRLRESEGDLRILRSTTDSAGRIGGTLFIPVGAADE